MNTESQQPNKDQKEKAPPSGKPEQSQQPQQGEPENEKDKSK